MGNNNQTNKSPRQLPRREREKRLEKIAEIDILWQTTMAQMSKKFGQ